MRPQSSTPSLTHIHVLACACGRLRCVIRLRHTTVPARRAGVVRYATQATKGRDGVVMRTASPSDKSRPSADRLPPAKADEAWRGLSQSFDALPDAEDGEGVLRVPEVDEVEEGGGGEEVGSLAHCLIASQWGTPATTEYAVRNDILANAPCTRGLRSCNILCTICWPATVPSQLLATAHSCSCDILWLILVLVLVLVPVGVFVGTTQRKFSAGLCEGHLRMFLESWCSPLGEKNFAQQVKLRRVNRVRQIQTGWSPRSERSSGRSTCSSNLQSSTHIPHTLKRKHPQILATY